MYATKEELVEEEEAVPVLTEDSDIELDCEDSDAEESLNQVCKRTVKICEEHNEEMIVKHNN